MNECILLSSLSLNVKVQSEGMKCWVLIVTLVHYTWDYQSGFKADVRHLGTTSTTATQYNYDGMSHASGVIVNNPRGVDKCNELTSQSSGNSSFLMLQNKIGISVGYKKKYALDYVHRLFVFICLVFTNTVNYTNNRI